MFFPGWKSPFSNTIGYLVTMLMNIKTVFTNMLVTDSNNKLLKITYFLAISKLEHRSIIGLFKGLFFNPSTTSFISSDKRISSRGGDYL